jgi:PhzF family phenazine biosynthesis protein
MSQHRCLFVDVFTDVPLRGNPLAVVLEAEGVDDATMAAFARYTNLSETTFVLGSDVADYRVRIFTPGGELPFAGHPTLGTAHAVLTAGLVAVGEEGGLVQECQAGLVPLQAGTDGSLTFTAPKVEVAGQIEPAPFETALGASFVGPLLAMDTGPLWITGRLADGEAVRVLQPDMAAVDQACRVVGDAGLNIYGWDGDGPEVRSFATGWGIIEDPVCGSGNVAVAGHLMATGEQATVEAGYVARQGRCIARDGRVVVGLSLDGRVTIGGAVVTVLDGTVTL